MIFVFTGNGKGKTTSALGMALRAAGAGKKVLMVQFLKDGSSSEIKIIKKIKNFKVRSFGRPGFGPYSEKDSQLARLGFLFANNIAKLKKCDLLVLDEFNAALKFKLIDLREAIEFLKEYGRKLDIVLTGRYCPKEIVRMADLATEFKEVRHYYTKNKKA
ncbi:MAG: cob(I)yrinic acid a,c-diamide adenosyltransferase, partial [Candidatus Nealsonbacteria bacterium]|nr:cob(I)yrinic acid a,c-diamide adenosyltransferase [Candidatus Nealsonbacteria bacterium]